MENKTNYALKNVKIHFKCVPPIESHQLENVNHKKFSNFVTFRLADRPIYTLFLKSGHVNVSGIPSFQAIPQVVSNFKQCFKCHISEGDVIIDNTTVVGNIHLPCPLFQLIPFGAKHHISVSIRPHYFPSAILRFKREKLPAVLLFQNGKVILLGGKSWEAINAVIHRLHAFMNQL